MKPQEEKFKSWEVNGQLRKMNRGEKKIPKMFRNWQHQLPLEVEVKGNSNKEDYLRGSF